MKQILLLSSVFIFLVLACASPSKNFDKGNFEKAYKGVLENFEKAKASRKDKTILNKSFSEMLHSNLASRESIFRKGEIRALENLYLNSEDLIENYYRGKRWLDDSFDEPMEEIVNVQDSLVLDISDFYYADADQKMRSYYDSYNKEYAMEAFDSYERIYKYSGGDYILDSLSQLALDEATVFILFDVSAWDFQLEWEIDRVFEDLESRSRKFREVIYEDDVPKVDCFVQVEFGRLDVDDSQKIARDNFSKEIIARYETYTDSTGMKQQKPIYETVEATVECLISSRRYSWEARGTVDPNFNYCKYRNRIFESERIIESKKYTTRGDDRALPEHMKNLTDQAFSIKEDDLIEELIEDIYRQVDNYYF